MSEACAELGDAERSSRLYELLSPYGARNMVSPAASFAGPATRYLALLAATRGDWDAARGHFAAATEAAARHHSTPMLALLALDQARLLARAGLEPERAGRLAAEAARYAAAVGMTDVAKLAREIASTVPAETALGTPPPQMPDRGTLRRDGDVWAIRLGDRAVTIPDGDGVRLIATLLARPGVEIPATELASEVANGGGPSLDDAARASYRRRLTNLRAAETAADPERAAAIRAEIDFIAGELEADGLPPAGVSSGELARLRVTRAVRLATRHIGELDRDLGRQLDSTIRTGNYCAHEPDPRHPVTWQVDA
jgi:hypothetical protein